MAKILKILRTAPELERLILNDLATAAICSSITAVTVTPLAGDPRTNWQLAHINAPGGAVPKVCADICGAAVERLREEYDLLLEIEASEL